MKKKPLPEVYGVRREVLGEYERLSKSGAIDLYYGDEAGVSLEPNVPYGWQFRDEEVSMPSEKGVGINCFGLFTRTDKSWTATRERAIDAAFVVEQLERFLWSLSKPTVVCWTMRGFTRAKRCASGLERGSVADCLCFICRLIRRT